MLLETNENSLIDRIRWAGGDRQLVARHEEIERIGATPRAGGSPGDAVMRRGAAAIASLARRRQAMSELPPANVTRWTIRRKAAVVTAVAAGQITREEVYRRYQISPEEFLSWQRAYEAF